MKKMSESCNRNKNLSIIGKLRFLFNTFRVNDWGSMGPQAPFGGYKDSGIGREM